MNKKITLRKTVIEKRPPNREEILQRRKNNIDKYVQEEMKTQSHKLGGLLCAQALICLRDALDDVEIQHIIKEEDLH